MVQGQKIENVAYQMPAGGISEIEQSIKIMKYSDIRPSGFQI